MPRSSAYMWERGGQKDLHGLQMESISPSATSPTTECCDGWKTLEESAFSVAPRTTAMATFRFAHNRGLIPSPLCPIRCAHSLDLLQQCCLWIALLAQSLDAFVVRDDLLAQRRAGRQHRPRAACNSGLKLSAFSAFRLRALQPRHRSP